MGIPINFEFGFCNVLGCKLYNSCKILGFYTYIFEIVFERNEEKLVSLQKNSPRGTMINLKYASLRILRLH